nr:hypothetical protein [Tanacetum cinerariifolium]
MADSAWIESMQEELHQFDRLEEEVYVNQPDGFVDPYHSDKVYRLKKALYGLKQAPKAWYDELSNFLVSKGFFKGSIDPTLFITKHRGDILLIHQSPRGIFINQAKYAQEILKKHGMTSCDSVGTPMATKHLDADLSETLVDQTKYRSMVEAPMYLTDCTSMSSTEAEYVSLSAWCAQVLWMRTQLTDYGFHLDKIPMGNPKGGKISGKGKIKTGNLDFDDVYFVKELGTCLAALSDISLDLVKTAIGTTFLFE